MSHISNFLGPDSIDANLTSANKKTLFQQIALAASKLTDLPAKQIAAALGDREKIGTTGFGSGIAIPHGKIEGLPGITGFFARLTTPIDYQSIDGLPVDLVFLLLSPPDAGADHLKALASVSRVLRDKQTAAKLRGARSKDAIFALLAGVETLHAV